MRGGGSVIGAVLGAVLCVARAALGHPSPAKPYERLRIAQAFDARRHASLRARWDGVLGVPDPTRTGATVYVSSDPPGDAPAVIPLPAAGWKRGRGYRFVQRAGSTLVRASLRPAAHGGRFRLALHGRPDGLLPRGTTRVAVTVGIADLRWCAEAAGAGIRESPRWLVAKADTPLAACPCEPLPADAFAAIERRVFMRHTCVTPGCHGEAPGQGGLLLAAGSAYASLVSVASTADAGVLRVAPGDPEGSMLWRKVAARTLGAPSVPGTAMPIGDPAVGVAELEAVRLWILAGAPATGAVPGVDVLLACDVP